MGKKCCVINCKSGYDSEKKKPDYVPISIYGFPKDDEERQTWIDQLPKSNLSELTVTKNMGVCRKHFREDVRMRKQGDKFLPAEPPELHLNKVPASNYGEFNLYVCIKVLGPNLIKGM